MRVWPQMSGWEAEGIITLWVLIKINIWKSVPRGYPPPFLGNSVTVFSSRQRDQPQRPGSTATWAGPLNQKKKAKSKQIPLQDACRGLGKGRERKGDLDTGVTSPPLRAVSAMSALFLMLHKPCRPIQGPAQSPALKSQALLS